MKEFLGVVNKYEEKSVLARYELNTAVANSAARRRRKRKNRSSSGRSTGETKTNVLTFEVGQYVTWTDSDIEVPKGTVGVITRVYGSKSEATVTFPKGTWNFPFKKLNFLVPFFIVYRYNENYQEQM